MIALTAEDFLKSNTKNIQIKNNADEQERLLILISAYLGALQQANSKTDKVSMHFMLMQLDALCQYCMPTYEDTKNWDQQAKDYYHVIDDEIRPLQVQRNMEQLERRLWWSNCVTWVKPRILGTVLIAVSLTLIALYFREKTGIFSFVIGMVGILAGVERLYHAPRMGQLGYNDIDRAGSVVSDNKVTRNMINDHKKHIVESLPNDSVINDVKTLVVRRSVLSHYEASFHSTKELNIDIKEAQGDLKTYQKRYAR